MMKKEIMTKVYPLPDHCRPKGRKESKLKLMFAVNDSIFKSLLQSFNGQSTLLSTPP